MMFGERQFSKLTNAASETLSKENISRRPIRALWEISEGKCLFFQAE